MTIDAQGQVHLLWDTNSSDVPQYIYHAYLTATTWTSPTYIAYSLGTSRVMFPPVVGPGGKIHSLWTNERASGDADRMLYVFFEDGQWHPVGGGCWVTGSSTATHAFFR
jgi:hypothetical protein